MRQHIFYLTVFLSIIGLMSIGTVDSAEITEYFDSEPDWTSFNLPVDDNDFGFRNSNFAGGNTGEAGGFFSRTDQITWYGDDTISNFTGNEVLSASGLMNIYNVEPGYNNNIHIGHFDSAGPPELNGIGFQILENEDTSPFSFRIFYKIGPTEGLLFIITGINESRTWRYLYDPDEGNYGSLTVSISGSGGNTVTVFLSESQRSSIGILNYFGISEKQNSTSGSEQCEFYIDNVSYTVTSPNAIITPYSNRILFYSAIESNPSLDKTIEGWDSFSEGAIIANGSTVNGIHYFSQLGDFRISWRGAQTSRPSTLGTTGRPGYAFWPGDLITFTFDRKCLGFGVSINTAGRNDGNYKAITNTDDIVLSYYDPFPGYDTGQFVGFISDTPFSQITLASLPFPPGENVAYGFDDLVCAIAVVIEVDIDIKPGSYPNSINLKSKGKIPIAILSTDDFDAYDVDPVSCEFAGAYPLRWNIEDVDNDGDQDMLLHYKTQELFLTKESTEETLEGKTYDGIPVVGKDSVNIVPKGKVSSKKIKK